MSDPSRAPSRPPAPAKLKILATADELFYAEGIHTVGVDRIIRDAHVTKATFYKHFPSKDLLVIAYVRRRDARVRELLEGAERRHDDPRAVVRSLVEAISAEAARPGFHGCPFINAAAQFPDPRHPVRVAVAEHRDWYSATLERLFARAGHPRPGDAADDVMLARDGALGGGRVGDSVAASSALKRSVERVLAEAPVTAPAA